MAATEAELFLRALLADGTEHPSQTVRAQAEAAGIPWRNVERARSKIPGLITRQRGFQGPRSIQLPAPRHQIQGLPAWPEYTPVTCLTCGRTAGMYHQPQSNTTDRCARCTPRP